MVKSSSNINRKNENSKIKKLTTFFTKIKENNNINKDILCSSNYNSNTNNSNNNNSNTNNSNNTTNSNTNNYPLFNHQQQKDKDNDFKLTSIPPLFCDLDGVLADHDIKMKELYGAKWRYLFYGNNNNNNNNYKDDFFNSLPWMQDGQELWNVIKEFNPTILTALPSNDDINNKIHDYQKRQWCIRELGKNVSIITTKGAWNKYKYCKKKKLNSNR